MNVLIIAGGSSSERKISLLSARAVAGALRENGHHVTIFDFRAGYPKLKKIVRSYDAIFPVMHGKEGEDGTLYRFLRTTKKPFVGSDPRGARVAFDKIWFKQYCDRKKLPTAEWKKVKRASDVILFGFPCVLKAAEGGSSHEVVLLHSPKDLFAGRVKKMFTDGSARLFVEKLITGPEITIGVLHNNALPVIEIIPPKRGWFDYKNKYSGATREVPFAPSVDKKLQKRAQAMAVKIHRDLGLGSFSRLDIIVEHGKPYILEVNTPGGVGLTSESLFPKAAKAAGISWRQLVEKMLPSTPLRPRMSYNKRNP